MTQNDIDDLRRYSLTLTGAQIDLLLWTIADYDEFVDPGHRDPSRREWAAQAREIARTVQEQTGISAGIDFGPVGFD